MAFLDIRFPVDISFGAKGGPRFSTTVVASDGGNESVNRNWTNELARYEVSYNAKLPLQWRALFDFFRVVGGRANTFRYKDWLDFAATSTEGKFFMLTSTTFQCMKRYTVGAYTYDLKITKPRRSITITGGSVSSVDYSTGVVTMSSGTPTAWAGEFDRHCRFDTDALDAVIVEAQVNGSLIVDWISVPLVEVRG